MAKNGGYRKPSKPAGVSGPGKYSQRTDGKPSEDNMKQAKRYVSGMGYGENKELNEIQAQGDLAAGPSASAVPVPQASAAAPAATGRPAVPSLNLSSLTPLDAPTQRPDEPVTAGAALGAGPGMEAIPGTPEYMLSEQEKQQVAVMYGLLSKAAARPNASSAVREMTRKVRSLL